MKRLLLLTVLLFTGPAAAHYAPSGMAYDAWCCNGDGSHGDCAPIPTVDVKETTAGWIITLHPGDHPLVTKVHVYTKRLGEERHSTDGGYHACLYPNENTLRCFYTPMPSS
jgi:hypothetical protein